MVTHPDIRELKHATFLSHRRTPEVYCFPILPVLTLPHLYALVEAISLKIWGRPMFLAQKRCMLKLPINPVQHGLTSVNRREPVFSLW